jgi:hypothetical protein
MCIKSLFKFILSFNFYKFFKFKMNDYYSEFPQPSADVRARNLVDVMLRDFFTPDELKNIALEVVKVSNEYSMTGYNMLKKGSVW